VFAYDVTEQVRSRRRVEESEKALQALNQELEAEVARRTAELQHARAEADLDGSGSTTSSCRPRR
jgi:C4-dicarboxylate-specific signal transduction histidine kinase